MDIGVISVRYARALLRSAVDAHIEDAVYAEMQSIAKSYIEVPDRENVMQFIANSYITLYRQQKNIIRGKLTTAARVSAQTEQKMRQMVESKTNGTVEFETEVNPDIIGGFILEYDTYRMDASVKSQLNTILTQLRH